MAIGLAAVLIGFIELGLSYTPWKIDFWSLVIALVVISLVCFLISVGIPGSSQECVEEPAGPHKVTMAIWKKTTRNWHALLPKDRYSRLFLGFTIVVSLVLGAVLIDIGNRRLAFTEFLISPNVFPEAPPWQEALAPGDRINIPLTVISHEVWTEHYYVQVLVNDQLYRSVDLGNLQPGQEITSIIPFLMDQSGSHKVEFHLHKDGLSISYRSLYIWLEVSK
jgi:uncharacterized membrane protein